MQVVMIGSMHHPELFEKARTDFGLAPEQCHIPQPGPTNDEIGHWHHMLDTADVVMVVPKPDGTLGAGTVAELRHVTGRGLRIIWGG